MKMKTIGSIAAVLLLTHLNPQSALAQGSLTPPGAPAQGMKTLAQIEPRTPISSAPFTINQPGSYYLTTNLTGVSGQDGVSILANNVTLDLNGFAVQCIAGENNAVGMPTACTNVTVCNGSITGTGSNFGMYGYYTHNLSCDRLNIVACGTAIYASYATVSDCTIQSCGYGIEVAFSTVSGCTVQSCSHAGISVSSSSVSGCSVWSCANEGIDADSSTVSDCTAQSSGDGIYASSCTVSGCAVQACSIGIYTLGSIVTGCCVAGSTNSGILVEGAGCQIIGNNCRGNNASTITSGAGIYLEDANNRIEDNHVSTSGYSGIQVENYSGATNNIIIRNTVSGNGAKNYITPGNQIVGPLITTYGTITNSNPWANFSF